MVITHSNDGRVGRKKVKQGRSCFEEERQKVFGATWYAAGKDLSVHRAGIMIDIESVVPIHHKTIERRFRHWKFARGKQVNAINTGNGALCFRVEGSNTIDFGIHSVDTVGCVTPHRKYVEQ